MNVNEEKVLHEGELKEEDRLAALVKNITFEAMLAPRGAIKKYPDGTIDLNPGFTGVTDEEALNPLSYIYLRYPIKRFTANLIQREEIDQDVDAFESQDDKSKYFR